MIARPSRWPPLVAGIVAAAGMVIVYTLLLAAIGGPRHPLTQFLRWWYFIVPVVAGFGVQVGLWRQLVWQHRRAGASAAVAGGSGGVAMLACCAHHAADVLPLLGFTALAALLGRYQSAFFAIALLSNLAGITWMLRRLRAVTPLNTPPAMPHPSSAVRSVLAGLGAGGIFVFAASLINRSVPAPAVAPAASAQTTAAAPSQPAVAPPAAAAALTRTDDQAEVTVSVTPRSIDATAARFDVKIDTHSVDFNVDFATASELKADGRTVGPATWNGGSSGHHLEGELTFPSFPPETKNLVLTISGVGGVVRTFSWTGRSSS